MASAERKSLAYRDYHASTAMLLRLSRWYCNRAQVCTNLAIGLILLGSVGCAPKVPYTYVNLNMVPTGSSSTGQPPTLVTTPSIGGSSKAIDGKSQSTLLFGISEDRYLAAIKENQNARQASTKSLADALFGALDAQIEDARRAAKLVLSTEEQTLMSEAVEKTRPVFEKYANQVGRLTLELSSLVGFPDKQTFGAPTTTKEQRAQEIRDELKRVEGQYLAERDALLNEVRTRVKARQDELEAQLETKRANEAKRIQTTVDAMLSRGVADAVNPVMARMQFSVSGSPSSKVNLPGQSGRTEVFLPRAPRAVSMEQIRRQAETWASLNGYKLTSDPSQGVEKTKEFWAWRSALQHGP